MIDISQIGIRAHDIHADTPAALAARAAEMNVPCVQLALRKSFTKIPWTNHTFSPGLAESIKMELGGLRISVLGSYINLLAEGEALENEMNTFKQNMLFAKFLGAGVVGTETGLSDGNEADFQKVLKNVRILADAAERLGVMIALEGVWLNTVNTPQKMRRILDEVNSPNVLTILDPVNYFNAENYRNQEQILTDCFELLKSEIAAVHIKDFCIENGAVKLADFGSGQLNIKLLLELIQKYKPGIDILFDQTKEESFEADRIALLKIAESIS